MLQITIWIWTWHNVIKYVSSVEMWQACKSLNPDLFHLFSRIWIQIRIRYEFIFNVYDFLGVYLIIGYWFPTYPAFTWTGQSKWNGWVVKFWSRNQRLIMFISIGICPPVVIRPLLGHLFQGLYTYYIPPKLTILSIYNRRYSQNPCVLSQLFWFWIQGRFA